MKKSRSLVTKVCLLTAEVEHHTDTPGIPHVRSVLYCLRNITAVNKQIFMPEPELITYTVSRHEGGDYRAKNKGKRRINQKCFVFEL